jgi:hypothetical protein
MLSLESFRCRDTCHAVARAAARPLTAKALRVRAVNG